MLQLLLLCRIPGNFCGEMFWDDDNAFLIANKDVAWENRDITASNRHLQIDGMVNVETRRW